MSYLRTGAPRNTSNGDYGRFHFVPNMASGQQMQPPQNAYYSTDGNRMMQHVHYPNCPNRNSPNKFSDGVKEYTVEYGEDAVRAALGGNMPDFQAQFQQQYGNTASAVNVDPQTVQMMSNGKSKVGMIPVVLTSEGDGNEMTNQASNAGVDYNNNANPKDESNAHVPSAEALVKPTEASETQVEAGVMGASNQENIANAFESARRARSTGHVKYGRHIRPSYWKPEAPNPCRKKRSGNGVGAGDVNDSTNGSTEETTTVQPNMEYMNNQNPNEMMMNPNGCFPPPPIIPSNAQQHNSPAATYQRTRSMPLKQAYSLCGKCKKCKNLRSEAPDANVLTFPKYSTGGIQRQPKMLTSSNLGQSAKNFRAIRFSSNHM